MARSKGAQNAEKRAAIVRASADLIDKVGYHGASMQLLADAVGLGKPTLYHYFRGKQDILFAIHQDLVGNLLETLEERGSEGLAPDALLRALCFDVLTLIRDHPGYMKALIEHIDELDGEQAEEARKGRLRYSNGSPTSLLTVSNRASLLTATPGSQLSGLSACATGPTNGSRAKRNSASQKLQTSSAQFIWMA